jgi:membrane-associated PAP2 superfamily phosphatase
MISHKKLARQLCVTAVTLLVTLLWFEFSSSDLWVQQWLFNSARHTWFWSRAEPVARLFFYDGIKTLLILSALTFVVSLVFVRGSSWVRNNGAAIRIVLVSIILVPVTVGALKGVTNVACPKNLRIFGGDLPYVKVFDHYPRSEASVSGQRCFPAGHASGGFALLSLYFLFNSRRGRLTALASALTLGWVMGGYKMAIGDHLLSHTVVSMELAWLLICLVALCDNLIVQKMAEWRESFRSRWLPVRISLPEHQIPNSQRTLFALPTRSTMPRARK